MADDVAALGFSVDSAPLKAGSDQLRIFQSVAQRTGETVEQVQKRFESLAASRRKELETTNQAIKLEKEYAAALKNVHAANDNVAGSTAIYARQAQLANDTVRQLAGNAGLAGSALATFGVAGVAAAAALAIVSFGFKQAADAALKLADDMGKLADSSETLGISIEQLRALQLVGGEVGISTEKLNTVLEKFSASLGQVREGSKEMSETFDKLSPGLAEAARSAGGFDEKLQLVFQALQKTDTAAGNLAAREIFGRGGAAVVRLAAAAGDITKLAASINALDRITGQQAKTWDQLGDSIAKNMKLASTNVSASFAEPVLKILDDVSKIVVELSRTFRLLATPIAEGFALDALEEFRAEIQTLNFQMQEFGADIAITDLATRLFGADFVGQVRQIITQLNAIATILNALTSLSGAAGMAVNAALTFDSSKLTTAVTNAKAAIQDIGTATSTIFTAEFSGRVDTFAERFNAATGVVGTGAKEWYKFGNFMEKLGGTVIDPVAPKLNKAAGAIGGAKKASLDWVDVLRANVTALGSAATAAERYELQVADLVKRFNEGEITQSTMNRAIIALNPAVIQVTQATENFVNTFVDGMLAGQTAAEAFGNGLEGIGKQLIALGSKDLAQQISGSFGSIFAQLAPALGSAGGPIGSLIAGVGVSLIGKLFGGGNKEAEEAARKQEEELKKAQEAWASMTTQLKDFNRTAAGLVKGELRSAIEDIAAQRDALAAAATKAKNFDAAAAVQATASQGISRLINEFIASLPRFAQELTGEGGLAGATSSAINSVEAFRKQVMGLRDSLNEAAEVTSALEFFGAQWGIIAAAAQQAALAMLELEHPLSEVEQQVQTLNGTASGLQSVLVELGMSAEDAAAAISNKLNKALDELRTNFIEDLIAKVNDLAGGAFINQGNELIKQVAQLQADAATLGVQTSLIDEFYIRSAQKIIDENELVGFQFEALVNMLGLAEIGLHEFTQAVEDTATVIKRTTDEINSTIMSYQDQLFVLQQNQDTLGGQLAVFDLQAQRQREEEIKKGGEAIAALEALLGAQRAKIIADWNAEQLKLQEQAAKDALAAQIKAIEAQKKAIQDQIKAVENAIEDQKKIIENAKKIWEAAVKVIEDARRTIQNFVSGFLGGTGSFLSPEQQMQTAIATFNQQLALAQQGDQQALQGITGQANNALTAIKNYFGSTATGADLQQQILNQLTNLPGQLDPSMLIVDAVDRQTVTQSSEAAAQIVKLQAQLTTLQSQLASLNSVDTSVDAVNTGITGVVTQTTGINTDTNVLTPIQTNTLNAATSLLALAQISSNTATTANIVNIHTSHLSAISANTMAIRQGQNQQNLAWGQVPATTLLTFARGGVVPGTGAVPIMAHAGEMVMNRSASQQFKGTLERMNSGGDVMGMGRIEDALQRLIGVVVMASETDHELLGSLASNFKTMAKAERRVR